jgi:serine/threonine protein kinase/Tol biopolymer transport system component
MTNPEQSAEELFAEALDLPPERRSAFLDEACRDAPELRRLIEQLLVEDQRAGSFLGKPAFIPDDQPAPSTAYSPSASARFQPTQLIANRFLVVRFIARGGMGEVYEAKDQFLQGASIALKIIRPEIAADAASASRFEQEVILARKVVHPNLCPIYEIFHCEQPAPPFLLLTMRLLHGETLYDRLSAAKNPEPSEAVEICNQLLSGVAALHAGGIIHRDLKPNNVMLERDGQRLNVSIMDFGLARLHEAENTLLGTGMIAGTPGYMAPELLRGERPTKATDLFALGVVLHQVLTGERPVASEKGLSVTPSPALRSANAPAALVQAVESFLSPDPASRYIAFERIRLGQSGATRTTFAGSSWLSGKARWYVAAATVAAIAFGIAVFMTPAPVSGPLDSTQVTSSAEQKEGPLFTDGSRLYFNSHGKPSEMAVSGGTIVPMSILGPSMYLLDISADGSMALGLKPDIDDNVSLGTLWTAPMLGGTPRKLTNHLAFAAAWSPDGRSIVFADRSLYRIDADGENLRKIWDAPAEVRGLSFSPDGQQLSVTVGALADIKRLWLVRADGQNAHPLPFDWPENVSQYSGEWTPDGRHFLFSSDREGRDNVYELVAPRWFEFWKKPTAVRITGNQLAILASTPPRNGSGLFVLGRMDIGAMRAYDPHSGKLTPFLDDVSMIEFVISPDRQWIAYSEYPSRYLWKSKLDGSEKLQLTHSYAEMQQWSPDGKWLVYSDWHNLYLVPADGGAPEKLTPDGPGDLAPTWFPDGKSIAFNYFPYPGKPLGIRVLDLASRRISAMPNAEGYLWPSWSPDGKYLVAIAENPARMVLYSAERKTWKDLHRFDVIWSYWTWARDSKSLYFGMVEANQGIYRLTVPEGEWTKLSGLEGVNDPSGFDSFMSLTPEGQPAIMSRTGVAQIYLLHWKP